MLEWLPALVVLAFAAIHLIEVSAMFSRVAGVAAGRTAGAYALQNAVQVTTRFFQMALLPALGLLVDLGQSRDAYLAMVIFAMVGASTASLLVLLARGRLQRLFTDMLEKSSEGQSLLLLLIKAPVRCLSLGRRPDDPPNLPLVFGGRIFWLSAVIFAVYASSMFLVFYGALLLPEYRASISHLSGISNALAAVVLTFVIEPRISHRIDGSGESREGALNLLMQLICGRVLGVAILGSAPFVLLYLGLPA